MEIKTIIDRAHDHAVKIGAYNCPDCDNRDLEDGPEYECSRCYGSGKTSRLRIESKLKEEIIEFNNSDKRRNPVAHITTVVDFINEGKKFPIAGYEECIKGCAGDELADIIITALAGAKELNIPIEKHIEAKLSYNEIRKDHNGT